MIPWAKLFIFLVLLFSSRFWAIDFADPKKHLAENQGTKSLEEVHTSPTNVCELFQNLSHEIQIIQRKLDDLEKAEKLNNQASELHEPRKTFDSFIERQILYSNLNRAYQHQSEILRAIAAQSRLSCWK
jgi:hypothetical protein